MDIKVLHQKPTPQTLPAMRCRSQCIRCWRVKPSLLGHGPGQCRWLNLSLQHLDLGNVTEMWRIVKTWKYWRNVCHSLLLSGKIQKNFSWQTYPIPGAALPWMTNPSHWGTVIAAPLKTGLSLLWGNAMCRRQTTQSMQKYSSCKIPFL